MVGPGGSAAWYTWHQFSSYLHSIPQAICYSFYIQVEQLLCVVCDYHVCVSFVVIIMQARTGSTGGLQGGVCVCVTV